MQAVTVNKSTQVVTKQRVTVKFADPVDGRPMSISRMFTVTSQDGKTTCATFKFFWDGIINVFRRKHGSEHPECWSMCRQLKSSSCWRLKPLTGVQRKIIKAGNRIVDVVLDELRLTRDGVGIPRSYKMYSVGVSVDDSDQPAAVQEDVQVVDISTGVL